MRIHDTTWSQWTRQSLQSKRKHIYRSILAFHFSFQGCSSGWFFKDLGAPIRDSQISSSSPWLKCSWYSSTRKKQAKFRVSVGSLLLDNGCIPYIISFSISFLCSKEDVMSVGSRKFSTWSFKQISLSTMQRSQPMNGVVFGRKPSSCCRRRGLTLFWHDPSEKHVLTFSEP